MVNSGHFIYSVNYLWVGRGILGLPVILIMKYILILTDLRNIHALKMYFIFLAIGAQLRNLMDPG